MKCPPFDTVSTVQAVVESWHTWMIDNVHQIRIKCLFETIELYGNCHWMVVRTKMVGG